MVNPERRTVRGPELCHVSSCRRSPKVTTLTRFRCPASDFEHELHAPYGRGSRLSLPRNSLTDGAPA
eukprot:8405308-Pyramimonas_sp.AAC.1